MIITSGLPIYLYPALVIKLEKTPGTRTTKGHACTYMLVNDVSDGLKKAKERKVKLETITASERFDRLKTYMKSTIDSIKMGKKLDSILSAMTKSPFNLNKTVDEFYKSRVEYYVNDFKGDILAMFESVKKDINGMLSRQCRVLCSLFFFFR